MDKLIFILDSFSGPAAGTEGQFDMLYKGLVAQGQTPRVLTFRHSKYLEANLPQGTYENLGIGSLASPIAWLKALKAVRTARRQGVRLAHLFFNDTSILLPGILHLVGIKSIVSRRDLGFWYTRGKLFALRINKMWVSRVLANCQAVKLVTMQEEGYADNKVQVILNGVQKPSSFAAFDLRTKKRDGFAQPTADTVIYGMVANLRPLKRVNEAIRALAALKNEGLDVRLVVAGADFNDKALGGSQLKKLQELAKSENVHEEVLFTGSLSPAWGFMDAIDVLLSCSETEGLSNSIIEAMACDKAVVATEVGGTADVVNRGVSGLLYTVGHIEELVLFMRVMATEPVRRVRMGKAGGDFVRLQLTPQALMQAHAQLYAQVLAQ